MPNPNRKHSRQLIFDFIVSYKCANDGNSPSLREIMTACGVTSSSNMQFILNNLVDENLIRIRPGQRNIQVVGGCWSYSSPVLPPSSILPCKDFQNQ
jgi:SOS-response transcriptional repressor LexA